MGVAVIQMNFMKREFANGQIKTQDMHTITMIPDLS